jgi:DNA polymerase-1
MPGIRECFRARAGTFFLACDFDAQEMRTLAQSCLDIVGSSKLAERFQADRHFDPHLEFAAMLAKISVTEAQQRKAEGDPRIKELRQQSKAANFGYPGGMGSERFIGYARGYGVTLTEMQSADLRESWFAQWPEMRDYFVHVQNVIGSAGCGQQTIPQSGFVRGNCGYSDTANGYFQTLAAHASKAALFEVAHRAFCRHDSYLYGSRPVLFIHDEIVLETPIEAGHDAAKELERTMIETLEKWTPEVPAAASATLMKRWSKKAEQTYDGDRLVAWDGGA